MKLNVGSGVPRGSYCQPEWLNIDDAPEGTIRPKAGVNFQKISVLAMPEDWANKFEEIHCVHMLEHMNRNLRQQVMTALHRVLVPGGLLCLEVPDFEEVVSNLHAAYMTRDLESIHIWKTSIYGKQRYDGDAHHWGFDAEHLKELAQKAGFHEMETWTNSNPEKMISGHYKQEPVILLKAVK